MSVDSVDNAAYRPVDELTDEAARRHFWACAIGLQAVDGLEVSPYLREVARDYIAGKRSLDETGELVRAYHKSGRSAAEDQEGAQEADLVSQRIAEVLAKGSFALIPEMPRIIHRELFRDLPAETYHAGEYKLDALMKQEEILNGDSVLYADPVLVEQSLRYLVDEEREAGDYGTEIQGEKLERFSRFVALAWQVHPFWEGNTRTMAVFAALYLKSLGFSIGNEPFEHHARYFRDALVRANYRNAAAKIMPDLSFVVRFFDNLVNGADHTLDREDLICPALFDDPGLLRNVSPSQAFHQLA